MQQRWLGALWCVAASLWLSACAEGTPGAKRDPEPIQCRGSISVQEGDGECAVPSLGQGDVEAPQGGFEPPTLDNGDLEEDAQFFLTQEGPGKFRVYVGETIAVGVRAIKYVGQAAPGFTVDFKLEGETFGSAMNADRAVSNQFGVAQIQLTGGTRPTHFVLRMTAENATGLQYEVDVVQRPVGPDGELAPPEAPDGVPPGGGLGQDCQLETRGIYDIHNRYEPARFLGEGPFQVIDQVHQALSDPGGFVADLIADRIDGIVGDVIRAAIAPVVNYLVDYVIGNYAPDWAQWMLVIAEDVSGLLTELEIDGTMELGARDPATCALRGKHRWERLVFLWRAGCEPGNDACGRFPIEMNELGIALSESEFTARITRSLGPVGDLQIDEHALQLNVGVAVLWFVENVILPQRLEVRSFGELLGLIIPCDAVGALVADYVSGIPFLGFAVEPFVEEACEAGLEAAGNFLMRQIAESLNVSTFSMRGECKIRDTNGDRSVDRLEEGRWTQGFEGDFEGTRRQ
jgi:hypothetical protein